MFSTTVWSRFRVVLRLRGIRDSCNPATTSVIDIDMKRKILTSNCHGWNTRIPALVGCEFERRKAMYNRPRNYYVSSGKTDVR